MKRCKDFYQQGDVLFMRVDSIPDGLTEKKGNVLVEGEATGHHHSLHVAKRIAAAMAFKILYNKASMFVENKEDVTVKHQEHEAFTLPPGKWQIGQVREVDHFEKEIRRVTD